MAKPELKDCPFCGGAGRYKVFSKPFVHGWVGCPDCGIYINWVNTAREAVEKWNRRYYREQSQAG